MRSVYVKQKHQTGATAQVMAQRLDTLIQAAQWELDTEHRSSNPGAILRAAMKDAQNTLNDFCDYHDDTPEAG